MRIFLGGRDIPRDDFALIGVGESTGVPVVLLPEDGEVFVPEDYISLGYTNFEVLCIGAVGGRGGLFKSMRLDPTYSGGAGGGGGLHRVVGLLADLPDTVLVAIGQPGADGQDASDGWPMTPVLDGSGNPATPLSLYPTPGYVLATPGGDGGASSFGDICRASGGKGGDVARQGPWLRFPSDGPTDYELWQVSVNGRAIPGDGGEGGLGDRLTAGGGGAGGQSDWTDLEDENSGGFVGPSGGRRTFTKPGTGNWDGAIGAGGGGGVGELQNWLRGDDTFTITSYLDPVFAVPMQQAANGAKGSFSYLDIGVYGPGQSAFYGAYESFTMPMPGSGGGAKLNKVLGAYGSHAVGAKPNGVVLIRITKVE